MLLLVKITFLILLTNHIVSSDPECPQRWLDCGNGRCVAALWRCDGDNDCGNMKDEHGCEYAQSTCLSSQFGCESDKHCIPEKWHCDGDTDCDDGSDEMHCDNSTDECVGFRCQDNHCIPQKWFCDGQKDCPDGSDEVCTPVSLCADDQFLCSSGSCLNRSLVCDGKKDCSDGSDEGLHCGDPCENATCSQQCKTTPSGPQCYCDNGYQLDPKDNKTCLDIDECMEEGFCSQICANTRGSFNCSCLEGYELINRTCRAIGGDPLLIFTTLQEIRGMNLRSNRYFLIQKAVNKSVAVDADPISQRIYWVDVSNNSVVYSAKVDGTDFRTVIKHGLLVPEDIAVDYVGRHLYITDHGLKQVLVCKMDGTICHVLHDTNIEKPRSLALDTSEGFLYWSDWGDTAPGIYRSGMDGSRRIHLVSKNIAWPNGIAIDHSVNRLYWVDAKLNSIEYISLDGNTRKVLLNETVFHPYSLTVFEDTLYWTDWSTFSLESCNKFTGHKMTLMARESGKYIMGIHVYHPVLVPKVANPCWSSDCSHMCLIAPGGTYSCACPSGFDLAADGKTCTVKDVTPSLFVSEGSSVFYIRPQAVGSGAIMKLPLYLDTAMISRVSYDQRTKTLFVADVKMPAIYAINMTTLRVRELVKNGLMSPEDLVFDWMSNNLYWVDSSKGTVEVISADGLKRSAIVTALPGPVALAIARTGHMFVSTIARQSITMYDMDGRNEKILLSAGGFPMSIAVHPSKSLIYWADPRAGTISYMNYTRRSPRVLLSRLMGVMSVAVSEEYIYWTVSKRELHMLKYNSTFVIHLPGQDTRIVSRKVTYTPMPTGESACLIANGGCSYLCLTSPGGKTCACPAGSELANDNVSCIAKTCDAGDFPCVSNGRCLPTRFRCDGSRDCEDGSDEIKCDNLCSANDFRCRNGRCILNSFRCDHRNDCKDNSDEEDCPEVPVCTKDQMSCANGECISILWRCDGEKDCLDGSDELGCNSTLCDKDRQVRCDNGQCIPIPWVCDGGKDCYDGSDEKNCTKSKTCKLSEYRCERDGTCIDKVLKCDGRKDCEDGSDERNCQNATTECKNGMHRCKNGVCIYLNEICDGHDDCTDNEDELNCNYTNCLPEEVQCISSKRCIVKRWICDGDEDCEDGSDEVNCEKRNAVTPLPRSSASATDCDGFFCYVTGQCLSWSKVCDGNQDCEELPDEGGLCSKACGRDNGGCAQICIKTPQGPKCACSRGYKLLPDQKTCGDIDECLDPGTCSHYCNNTKGGFKCSCADNYFLHYDHRLCKAIGGPATLVYLLSDQIRGIDLVSRTQRVYLSVNNADMRGMDYDASESIFYWTESNDGSINSYSPDTLRQDIIVRSSSRPYYVRYDWIAKNLYYTGDDGSIGVCSKDGKYCSTLLQSGTTHIDSMDISPTTGQMFWTIWASHQLKQYSGLIERADMDGSHRLVIVSDKINWPTAITVDHILHTVYWTDSKLNTLECADFQGFNRRQIVSQKMQHPFAMAIFEDHVYWADWALDKIFRCEKFTGKDCSEFHDSIAKVEVLSIIHRAMQPKGINKCLNSNCPHLCLPTRISFTCKCADGYFNDTCEGSTTTTTERMALKCTDDFCIGGGKCYMKEGKRICQCPPNRVGHKCETLVDKSKQAQPPVARAGYDYSWIVAVMFAVLVIGVIVGAYCVCKLHRERLHRVSESVSVKFRNQTSGQDDHRLIDMDDGNATDELMGGHEGEYRRSPFGSGAYTLHEPQEGDFKKWPSYDARAFGDSIGRLFGRLKRDDSKLYK